MKITVGITGATGVVYGIRLLEALRGAGAETSLILTQWAEKTISYETDYSVETVRALADHVFDNGNLAAPVASGSYPTDAMVVAPCSMKSLSGIANAYDDDLLIRAADVCLKERRRLILLVRETPLNLAHIENMKKAALMGAVIMPPSPSFYGRPQTVDDVVNQTVGRMLDCLGVPDQGLIRRWGGEG